MNIVKWELGRFTGRELVFSDICLRIKCLFTCKNDKKLSTDMKNIEKYQKHSRV